MNALFRAARASHHHRYELSITILEERNLLATTAGALPPVNLSPAQVTAFGQDLANFAKHFDGSNAVADLTAVETAINNQINSIEAHPGRGFQHVLLQIDVDNLAIVKQAISDLAPPVVTATPTPPTKPVIA